jgi:hypothetical protein
MPVFTPEPLLGDNYGSVNRELAVKADVGLLSAKVVNDID